MTVNRDYAGIILAQLRRDLEDTPAIEARLATLGELFGRALYVVEVAIGELTLVFDPDQIWDGGAIRDDTLVEIRRAAGQDVAYRPRPSTVRPGKYFTDVISTETR